MPESDEGLQTIGIRGKAEGNQLGQRLGVGAVRYDADAAAAAPVVSHRDDVGAAVQSRRVFRLRHLGVGLGRRRMGRGRSARRDDPLRRRGTAARARSDTRGWGVDRIQIVLSARNAQDEAARQGEERHDDPAGEGALSRPPIPVVGPHSYFECIYGEPDLSGPPLDQRCRGRMAAGDRDGGNPVRGVRDILGESTCC